MFPLVTKEIPDLDLCKALNFGTLPSIYLSEEPGEDLRAYCGTYLQEEIQAEGAVRRIENFFRTSSGQEVDFFVGDELAVEVKASDNVTERDLRSLRLLGEEVPLRQKVVVSTERTSRRVRDVEILPVVTFLDRLWRGEYKAT